jgi:hypothetical protein
MKALPTQKFTGNKSQKKRIDLESHLLLSSAFRPGFVALSLD